jgi:hypothetical protein
MDVDALQALQAVVEKEVVAQRGGNEGVFIP